MLTQPFYRNMEKELLSEFTSDSCSKFKENRSPEIAVGDVVLLQNDSTKSALEASSHKGIVTRK